MAKIESINFREFMSGGYKKPSTTEKVVAHLKNHRVVYTVAGYTVLCVLVGPHMSFAATDGIDKGAKSIYYTLARIGKWIIIIKGGWETINSAIKSDFDSAKKNFLSYGLIYVILLGFPWMMDQIDHLFHTLPSDVMTDGSVKK